MIIVFTCSFTSDQTESVGEDIQRADERIEKEKQAENLGQSHQHSQHFTSSVQFCCSFFKKIVCLIEKAQEVYVRQAKQKRTIHMAFIRHYWLMAIIICNISLNSVRSINLSQSSSTKQLFLLYYCCARTTSELLCIFH